jgi:hypothetical protein
MVPPHKVPNVCLATFGTRHMVRVFFPHLYGAPEAPESTRLSKTQQAQFYDLAIRKAVLEVCSDAASDWPISYQDEMFRAKKMGPGFAWGTKPVGSLDVEEFGQALRRFCEGSGESWMKDIVFQVQIRGLKLATCHDANPAQAQASFDLFTKDLDLTVPGQVWVDVGLEVSVPDSAVMWRTTSHPEVVRRALDISQADANTLTDPTRRIYQRDVTAHLPALSGCRIHTHTRSGPYETDYIQLYSTEKNPTYHPERGHHAKYITTKMAMRGNPPSFITQLHNLYGRSADQMPVSARMEVRVPIAHAQDVLLDWTRRRMENHVVVMDQWVWW